MSKKCSRVISCSQFTNKGNLNFKKNKKNFFYKPKSNNSKTKENLFSEKKIRNTRFWLRPGRLGYRVYIALHAWLHLKEPHTAGANIKVTQRYDTKKIDAYKARAHK